MNDEKSYLDQAKRFPVLSAELRKASEDGRQVSVRPVWTNNGKNGLTSPVIEYLEQRGDIDGVYPYKGYQLQVIYE